MAQRYEVRIIGAADMSRLLSPALLATDSAAEAKALAEREAGTYQYGTAIVDRQAGTVDCGDEILDLADVRLAQEGTR
jgi:hypothetical protein